MRVDGRVEVEGELTLTNASSAIPPQTRAWLDAHGLEQLGQLNAMERGQDVTTWSTNAIYSATNGVLIVATVTAYAYDVRWLIIALLGILGAFLTTIWFTIVLRAHQYEVTYLYRARWLQMNTECMPRQCAIWQEPDGAPVEYLGRPPGTSSWDALRALVLGFFLLWIILLFLAVILGIDGVQTTDVSGEWKLLLEVMGVIALTLVSSLTLYRFFWTPLRKTDRYFTALRKALSLPDS